MNLEWLILDWIMSLIGIINYCVLDVLTIEEVLFLFLVFLYINVIVVYNVFFDMCFLKSNVNMFGLFEFKNKVIDIVFLVKKYMKYVINYKFEMLKWMFGICLSFYNVFDDCIMCVVVY